MEFKYLLFRSSKDLFHVRDFKRNLADGNLIRKCVLKELDVAVFIVTRFRYGKVSRW